MLTPEDGHKRLTRFLSRLEAARVDAAVISDPRDIYYLTGVLPEVKIYHAPSLLFVGPGLDSWLATYTDEGEPGVDDCVLYEPNVQFTINPDNHRRLAEVIRGPLAHNQNLARLGYQREHLAHSLAGAIDSSASPGEWVEVDEILQDLQLRKDGDELALIREAVRADLIGYDRAQQVIAPGVSELEVLTECQMAVQRHTGRPHYYGGDFRANEFGGPARDRALEAGELYIIDAQADIDGYWSDMSRAWVVGGEPTDLQASVYDHLAALLNDVPTMATVGRDTRDFWRELDARIREHPEFVDTGLSHHGGHGLGLRPHEGPDITATRGGVFEVGNTFTCEPGAYTEALRCGIRLENNFIIAEDGCEVVLPYPLALIPDPNANYAPPR